MTEPKNDMANPVLRPKGARQAHYATLFDSVHHLVYAALIDGVCTVSSLMEIIPRSRLCIQRVLQDLVAYGYAIKEREAAKGNKVAYLPLQGGL